MAKAVKGDAKVDQRFHADLDNWRAANDRMFPWVKLVNSKNLDGPAFARWGREIRYAKHLIVDSEYQVAVMGTVRMKQGTAKSVINKHLHQIHKELNAGNANS